MDQRDLIETVIQNFSSVDVRVTTNCIFWKPVKILATNGCYNQNHSLNYRHNREGDDIKVSDKDVFIGRAVNQYFVQRHLSRSNHSNVWLCFDVVSNEFVCLKEYDIIACRRERSIRFNGSDMDVISVLDKVVDEIIYHSASSSIPGVATLREVLICVSSSTLFMVMDYYPSQLMYYDYHYDMYRCCIDSYHRMGSNRCNSAIFLYKENCAKVIIKDLLETISILHKAGTVHKDLKPENILLTHLDASMFEDITIPMASKDAQNSETESSEESAEAILLTTEERGLVKSFVTTCVEPSYYTTNINVEVSPNFPYQASIDSCFSWVVWDKCRMVCDVVLCHSRSQGSIHIGKAALEFAKEILKSCKSSSSNVLDYFLLEKKHSLSYKKNPLFLSAAERMRHDDAMVHSSNMSHARKQTHIPSAVITDFGVSSIGTLASVHAGDVIIYDAEGTTAFTSPECLKYIDDGISGNKRDVYSLGVVLYVMIYGKMPYKGRGSIELLMNMQESPLIFHEYRKISQDLKELLLGMLQQDSTLRYDADLALAQKWFLT